VSDFAPLQTWALTPEGIAVWLTVLLGIAFVGLLAGAERRIRLGRDAALLALLAAIASAARVLFVAIPNVQPVTLLILLIGVHLGARRAAAVAVLVALISNMALGHGTWTFYQAVAWTLVGLSGRLARPLLIGRDGMSVRLLPLALLGFGWGFVYDWIISLTALAMHQSFELYIAYLIQGLVFDVLHAAGNVFFAITIGPALHRLLWLHLRHDAGSWVVELPEDVQRREALLAGVRSAVGPVDPMAGLKRLDREDGPDEG